MEKNIKTRSKPHYAWVIFVACFLMVGCALGFCSSPGGQYLKSVSEDLGISRTAYSVSTSLRFITTAVINLFFGKLIVKLGARTMATIGFCCLTASCIVNAFATGLISLYIGGIFLGLGLAWTTTSLVGFVVGNWFTSKKGTIMGIILASNGLMGAGAIQLLSPMIYAPNEGWRTSYRVCAVVMVCIGILVTLFLRGKPEDKSMTPLGDGKIAAGKQRGRDWSGISAEEAFHKPYFYICAVCVFLTGMLLHAVSNVAPAHLEDSKISTQVITNISSISSLVLLCSKTATGFSFDKFGLRFTMTMCNIFASVSILILAFAKNDAMAYASAILRSMALPLETIMLPLIASELFGRKSFAHMMGLMVSFNTLGYATGGPAINMAYELCNKDYRPAMYVLCALMVVVCIAMQYCISTAHKIRTTQEKQEW